MHFDSSLYIDIFTSTQVFTSMFSLRLFCHFGSFTSTKDFTSIYSLRLFRVFFITSLSIHSLRYKNILVEVPCTSTQKTLHFDPTPSTQSFTSTHSLREGKSIEVNTSLLMKVFFFSEDGNSSNTTSSLFSGWKLFEKIPNSIFN